MHEDVDVPGEDPHPVADRSVAAHSDPSASVLDEVADAGLDGMVVDEDARQAPGGRGVHDGHVVRGGEGMDLDHRSWACRRVSRCFSTGYG